MKKLILFLLLPLWAMAQTTTGQEQEFDYGIKNNSTQTITTPPYLTTTGMDGTQGKIPSALIAKTSDIADSLATKENIANKSDSYTTSSSITYASTKALVDGLSVKNWIKSNESLALAQRKGDVLYGVLDQYTGKEMTLSKVTGTPTVDGVIYFQLGAEYFKRDFFGSVDVRWFGAKEDGIADDYTAIMSAVNYTPSGGLGVLTLGNSKIYNISNTIDLADKSIIFDGNNSTINLTVNRDYALKSTGSIVQIKNLKLFKNIGVVASGIYLQGYEHNINNISSRLASWVNFMHLKELKESNLSNIRVDNSLSKTGTAIFIEGCVNNTISNSMIAYADQGIYANSYLSTEGLLINNTTIAFVNKAVNLDESTFVSINNCILDFITNRGVYATLGKNLVVSNTWIAGNADDDFIGIGGHPNFNNITATNNSISVGATPTAGVGVSIVCPNSKILNNYFGDSIAAGVVTYASSSVAGNTYTGTEITLATGTKYRVQGVMDSDFVKTKEVLITTPTATAPKLIFRQTGWREWSTRIAASPADPAYIVRDESLEVDRMEISSAGAFKINSLSGTYNRLLYADSTGELSAPDIPTAPTAAPGTTGNQIATLDYVLANSGATTSGTYTPTLYDFANTSARKLVKATYSKIGDIVTVFIHLTVDVITANTDTAVTVSLPINKVNTSLYELGAGVGRLSSVNTNEFTVRTSNVMNTNDIIRLVFKPVSPGTNIVSASFSYAIN